MSTSEVMQSPATTGAAPPLEKQTTVGNYFVSNYPPFSFWQPERVGELYAALERAPAPGTPLGVYLHIPFCRKRCHFCYFKVYTDKDSAAIRAYIEGALKELRHYADKPFIGGRKVDFVYFGGGTPSYLSVDQLKHLTDGMKALLPWDEVEEVTFECEPGTLTEHKLKGIRELGVTRLSLGVENFNDHILEINGRAHHSKEIARSYGFARELGFPQINIDLIAGMVEETESNWLECIAKTIEMQPDSVTIYQMEVPYNTTIYKEMKAEGRLVAPVADWETKRHWVAEAFAELERAGYEVASAYTAVKDRSKTHFVYRDRLWAGADLLGLGVASFGHIGGTHYQNQHEFEPYINALTDGKAPIFRALTPSPDERLIREFILQLKLGRTSCSYFQHKFGVDVRERFALPLRTLHDWGYLSVEGDTVRLNRDGLLQVDRLLHEFFLPQHQHARYADQSNSPMGAVTSENPIVAETVLGLAKVLPVAFPLDDFYARAGLRLPRIETIEPLKMPEPYRSLLVHHNDMTPTLSAFHARLIRLHVLSRQQRDDFYFREVVLLADGIEAPIEFGAIRINLARFTPVTRRHILDERVPLGHLLRVHSVPHSSRPKAFFRLAADALMAQALKLAESQVLYGRRNTLLDAEHRPLAEVVEILPPVAEPAAGYLSQTQEEP